MLKLCKPLCSEFKLKCCELYFALDLHTEVRIVGF